MLCRLPWASGQSAGTQGAWQLTTATLGSAPSLLQFVFGLKRSAPQNMVACFPSASWPLSGADFREPLYQVATVCPLDFFLIGGNGRQILNVTELFWAKGKKMYISLRSSSKFQYFCLMKIFTELSETLRSNKGKSKRVRKGEVIFIHTIRVLYL